ncbi:chemotaxis protein histidine kinase CheA [Clostridium punense]|uniref:Chemotaxis protein histidine kinase CheA n=1 Tax=Clostridium punense TaxID=1054297 RepID=A0ABS4KCR7_9CLOT|nr:MULTISPECIES: hypothetical protein [Clostridium]EQB89092.1 hypothetical protein M918_21970 [Clostridium sp. BL8]MBP2024394.1 chemotaxis protein histidine kinase CheA [Clostridium punense]
MSETITSNDELSAINSKKMTELIALIEELVINRSSIEKIKNEINNNQYAKVCPSPNKIDTPNSLYLVFS